MPVHHVKNRPVIIGLTGGIASGKSTASAYFEMKQIPVIDSDQIVKDLWMNNYDMLDQIASVFHTLDKKVIAMSIFSDPQLRTQLNDIVHPYVFDAINKQLMALKDENIVVIDMPLLFEVGYQNQVDFTALIYVDEKTSKIRAMDRDHLEEDQASARIKSQMPIEEKKKLADFVLDNRGTKVSLYQAIDHMLGSLKHEE